MNNLSIKLPLAVGALLMCSTAVFAQSTETRSFSASVSGALQSDTGFLTGGQVQVQGVGQGSMTLSRGVASIDVVSGASAGLVSSNPETVTDSSAKMVSTFDFDRDVNTAAALVGIGNATAQGESIGGIGVVGSATGSADRSGTGTNLDNSAPMSGSASSATSAQGSLVGNFSTQNTLQLLGTGSLFAAAQSLDVGERNAGFAAGVTDTVAANDTGVVLNTLSAALPAAISDAALNTTAISDFGAGFGSNSILDNTGVIDINVANAGNGSVLASTSTGGFFGQGTTFGASATPTLAETNGFFQAGSYVAP
jgi:hypothetical protein